MDGYFRLKKIIEDYSKKEEIKFTDETISLYDLYIILNNKFNQLKQGLDTKNIEKMFNDSLKKHSKHLHVKCEILIKDKILLEISLFYKDKIILYYRADKCINDSQIGLDTYEWYGKQGRTESINLIEKILNSNEGIICEQLNLLDDCTYIVTNNKNSKYDISMYDLSKKELVVFKNESFSDSFFTVSIGYSTIGHLYYFINVNSKEDPNNTYNKFYYNLTPLYEIVRNNEADILKKIPVCIKSLEPTLKAIVDEAKKEIKSYTLTKKYLNN